MTIDIVGTSSLRAAPTIVRCAVPVSTARAYIRMHIRHLVCTDNFAGVERYVASTAAELARRGNTVEVIGGDPERMRDALRSGPVAHVAASSVVAVARANVRAPKPDLVHAHMTAADIAAVATRPLVRRPIVSTLHFAQPRGHDAATRLAYRCLRPLLAAEIAISTTVANAVGGDVTVIPNGVPTPRPELAGRPRCQVVLVAQRLEEEKDTESALRSFAESGLGASGWSLQIAGRGASRRSLEALAGELGIGESTEFLGHVANVEELMAGASVFLAPAVHEPFGLAVVEAMSLGLPVVAADGGAHRETVGTATHELLFPPGDAAAAARLLTELAADATKRAAIGHRNIAAYRSSFTIEAHVDRLEALYRRVLSG
jgi:glycosyltransferase involved in cell wall biosynthesis